MDVTSDSIPNAGSAPLDFPGSPQSQSHPKHLQRNLRRNAPYVERWCWGLQVVWRWNGWKKMCKTKTGVSVVKILSEKSRWLRELILNVMRRCIEWMHFSASKKRNNGNIFCPYPYPSNSWREPQWLGWPQWHSSPGQWHRPILQKWPQDGKILGEEKLTWTSTDKKSHQITLTVT